MNRSVDDLLALNPFPGLRPFSSHESGAFFGRDRHIDELVTQLREVSFVAVAGTSGCGKSSLVRAGLLETLRRVPGAVDGVDRWRVAMLRPGSEPMLSLARGLAGVLREPREGDDDAYALYGELSLGELGLVDRVRRAGMGPRERLLVVVDQFEELFRFRRPAPAETPLASTPGADEASAFVKLLLNAAAARDAPVSIVITMRSDWLGGAEEFRGLPEAINAGLYMVPRMTREQREEAIVGPIERLGQRIAPSLVQCLLNDVSDTYDDLPLMQHVLSRTWAQWSRASGGARPIELGDYRAEAVGSVARALSIHADEAFDDLEREGLGDVAEKVFRALTERVAEGREMRRPLRFEDLAAVVDAEREMVVTVIDRYRRADTAFLTLGDKSTVDDSALVDISHESLIRQWARLHDWAAAEHDACVMLKRLDDASAQPEANLLRGRSLDDALDWRNTSQPSAAWIALCLHLREGAPTWQRIDRFIDASRAAVDGVAREARRRRHLAWSFGVIFVAGLGFAAYAATRSAINAHSSDLASLAARDIDQDPAQAALFARRALQLNPANTAAEQTLRRAVATLNLGHLEQTFRPYVQRDERTPSGAAAEAPWWRRLLGIDGPTAAVDAQAAARPKAVADFQYATDPNKFAIASGNQVMLYESGQFRPIESPFHLSYSARKAWPVGDGKMLLSWTWDGQVRLNRVSQQDAAEIGCSGRAAWASAVSLSPSGRRAAVGCRDGSLQLWDIAAWPAVPLAAWAASANGPAAEIAALAISASGDYVVSGDKAGRAAIWKSGEAAPWMTTDSLEAGAPISAGAAIRDLAIDERSDGESLAIASDNGVVTVLGLQLDQRRFDASQARQSLPHGRPVLSARFFRRGDGAAGLLTMSDKRVWLWTSAADQPQHQTHDHDDTAWTVEASRDGEYIVSASEDGTARVWSTRSGAAVAELRGHSDTVLNARFGKDETQVLTGSGDGTMRVWALRAPHVLWAESDRWMQSAVPSPDGRRVAVCGTRHDDPRRGALCDVMPLPAYEDRRSDAKGLALSAGHLPGATAVGRVSWSADGAFVAGITSFEGQGQPDRAVVWDAMTGRDALPKWLRPYDSIYFAPKTAEFVAVSSWKHRVTVWPLSALQADKEPRPLLDLHDEATVDEARASPDGRWLVLVEGNHLRLVDREAPDTLQRWRAHAGQINAVRFSDDGRQLVTASSDRSARVWSVDDPRHAFVELKDPGHSEKLKHAAFSPDGRLVVTASSDNTVSVWDAARGLQQAAFHWHREAVNEVHFLGDSKSILSASDDGSVKLGMCDDCGADLKQIGARVDALLPRMVGGDGMASAGLPSGHSAWMAMVEPLFLQELGSTRPARVGQRTLGDFRLATARDGGRP